MHHEDDDARVIASVLTVGIALASAVILFVLW